MCRMICELNMMSISAWKSIFCSELRGSMQMDQFFGKVDEFFSLKRWAADGFQIVDSVQKNFSKANQPSKEMPITFQFKKREKFSCIFKTYKLFFGKQHFTKALWYYFISEIMKLGTELGPHMYGVPLR